MTRAKAMKYGPWVIVAFALGVMFTRDILVHQPAVAAFDSLVASKAAADSIIQEHADSAKAILPRIEWRERVVTRLVTKTDTLSIQASIQADSGHWQTAYQLRTQEADTLRLALSVATKRGDEAIQMASYWQLAFIADSSRRAEEWEVARRLAVVAKPKWYKRCGVMLGYSVRGAGPDLMLGCKAWP